MFACRRERQSILLRTRWLDRSVPATEGRSRFHDTWHSVVRTICRAPFAARVRSSLSRSSSAAHRASARNPHRPWLPSASRACAYFRLSTSSFFLKQLRRRARHRAFFWLRGARPPAFRSEGRRSSPAHANVRSARTDPRRTHACMRLQWRLIVVSLQSSKDLNRSFLRWNDAAECTKKKDHAPRGVGKMLQVITQELKFYFHLEIRALIQNSFSRARGLRLFLKSFHQSTASDMFCAIIPPVIGE